MSSSTSAFSAPNWSPSSSFSDRPEPADRCADPAAARAAASSTSSPSFSLLSRAACAATSASSAACSSSTRLSSRSASTSDAAACSPSSAWSFASASDAASVAASAFGSAVTPCAFSSAISRSSAAFVASASSAWVRIRSACACASTSRAPELETPRAVDAPFIRRVSRSDFPSPVCASTAFFFVTVASHASRHSCAAARVRSTISLSASISLS